MKAVGLIRYLPIDDPQSLVDLTLPDPRAGGRDLLVRVRAVSVNPVDAKQRAPRARVEDPPRVLGWDAAGTVVQVGEAASLFAPGDEVWYAGSIARPGCNAELQLVDERIVGRKPARLDFAQAASLPLTAITAWESLFERMAIPRDGTARGRTLLVVAGAGGVGSIAIQLARQLAGLTVVATASRAASRAWCESMGAHHVIRPADAPADYRVQLDALGIAGVDYALCAASLEQHFLPIAEALAPFGRVCSIVDAREPLPMMKLRRKSASFSWEGMFTRSLLGTPDMIEQHHLLNAVADLVDAGTLQATMTENLGPIDARNLRAAHRRIESGTTVGKLVLAGF